MCVCVCGCVSASSRGRRLLEEAGTCPAPTGGDRSSQRHVPSLMQDQTAAQGRGPEMAPASAPPGVWARIRSSEAARLTHGWATGKAAVPAVQPRAAGPPGRGEAWELRWRVQWGQGRAGAGLGQARAGLPGSSPRGPRGFGLGLPAYSLESGAPGPSRRCSEGPGRSPDQSPAVLRGTAGPPPSPHGPGGKVAATPAAAPRPAPAHCPAALPGAASPPFPGIA